MSAQNATSVIRAAPPEVRRLLLDPLALPSWNPAFTSIDGPPDPAPGIRYTIRVRPGLTGSLTYTLIGRERIDMAWEVPGFHETGSWTIEPDGAETLLHHRFVHTGRLASALRRAYRGIAPLRLQRLARAIEHTDSAA